MSQEMKNKIRADFPRIFKNSIPIETGSGWLDLIYKLCFELEEECKRQGRADDEWIHASQIKEKFGQLCFYYRTSGEVEVGNLFKITMSYMEKSAEICETCGLKGEMRDDNDYYHVCCDVCHKAYLAERERFLKDC